MSNREFELDFLRSAVRDYEEKAVSGLGIGAPQPEVQKPVKAGSMVVDLPRVEYTPVGSASPSRRSRGDSGGLVQQPDAKPGLHQEGRCDLFLDIGPAPC